MSRKKKAGLGLIVPVAIIFLWWLVTSQENVASSILPSLSMVGDAFEEMLQSGQLADDLFISISRVIKGFLTASILGIFFGTLMGMSKTICAMLQPLITTVRQIPMIAWFPLIILWCGIGELSKVVIIVLAAFFPVLVNTLKGIESTPTGLVEVADMYRLSTWKKFRKLYMPHALPDILVGLRLALGVSWMAVVASELVAATSGIGYRMNDARSMMRSDKVIVCMIVIGIIGVVMDKALSLLFTKLTPWENISR